MAKNDEDTGEDLPMLIGKEFKRHGFFAHTRDITRLADVLKEQGAEYGEIGIMAACVGYMAGKRG